MRPEGTSIARSQDAVAPDVSVIVVSHNSAPFIEQCLTAVKAGLRSHSYELILVDNASTDGTRRAIPSDLHPEQTIVLETNVGFARANNVGIERSHGRLLALVNSDAFPDSGSIDRLVDAIDELPHAGIIGGKLRDPSGRAQPSFGRSPSLLGGLWRAFFLHRVPPISRLGIGISADRRLYRTRRQVEWVTAAFCVARRAAGLVPARAFMYGEDVEWGLRCRGAGLEVWFEPAATAVHVGRGSVDREMEPGFALVQLADFELSWFACRGRLKLLLARGVLLTHALVRLVAYAPVELWPGRSRRRLREHAALFAAALRWRASGSREMATLPAERAETIGDAR